MTQIVKEIKKPLNVFVQGAAGCGKSFFVKQNLYKRFFEDTDTVIAVVLYKQEFIKEFRRKLLFKPFLLNVIGIEDFVNSNVTASRWWKKNLVVCELDVNSTNLLGSSSLDSLLQSNIIPKSALIYVDEPLFLPHDLLIDIIERYRKKVFCSQGLRSIGLSEDFVKKNFSIIISGLDYSKKETSRLKVGEFISNY